MKGGKEGRGVKGKGIKDKLRAGSEEGNQCTDKL